MKLLLLAAILATAGCNKVPESDKIDHGANGEFCYKGYTYRSFDRGAITVYYNGIPKRCEK